MLGINLDFLIIVLVELSFLLSSHLHAQREDLVPYDTMKSVI